MPTGPSTPRRGDIDLMQLSRQKPQVAIAPRPIPPIPQSDEWTDGWTDLAQFPNTDDTAYWTDSGHWTDWSVVRLATIILGSRQGVPRSRFLSTGNNLEVFLPIECIFCCMFFCIFNRRYTKIHLVARRSVYLLCVFNRRYTWSFEDLCIF